MATRRVCVFDVNETLLDLAALDAPFEQHLGDAGLRGEWFSQLLGSAFVSTITGAYQDFGALGRAALLAVAERHGVELEGDQLIEILGTFRQLPPHPDVPGALDQLAGAGFRLATLTNSPAAVAEAQLESAGIGGRFERSLSADSVRRLKPAREPYLMAADEAMATGAAAAFVARPGRWLDPGAEPPDIVGADLGEVAELIIAAET
jgi:2-haloacid dehalogenase